MKKSNIFRWIITVFLALMALYALTRGGSGFAGAVLIALACLLVIPLPFATEIRQKLKLNKVVSIVLILVLFVVGALLTPTTNTTPDNNNPSSSSVESTDNSSVNESSNISSNSSTITSSTEDSSKPNSSQTESIHSHSYVAATCTTPKTCSTCGDTIGSAKGHNWVDATYTAPKTCSICKITEGNPLDVPNSENYHGHVYTGGSSSKKYHYEAHCAGDNSHEITWDEVSKRNLGPCKTCVLK